jgi:hypothetical protein
MMIDGKDRARARRFFDDAARTCKLALLGACALLLGCGGAPPAPAPAAPSAPAAAATTVAAAPAAPEATAAAVQAAADAAFEYGYPLTETMRVCDLHPFVNWLHRREKLSTPQDTSVVLPNNDTLYATACAYLGAGWVTITMPPARGRYQSVQVFDAYTTTAALRGPKQVPVAGAQYVLHLRGSSEAGLPDGVPVIEVNTPFAFVLFRTLVNGPADLAEAAAAQTGLAVTARSSGTPVRGSAAAADSPGQDFFLKLMLRLAQNPPPASEAALIASFATAGIRPSLTPDAAGATAQQRAAWEAAYTNGLARLTTSMKSLSSTRGSWSFLDPNLATPGTNYALRALTARVGLFALPPSESIYPSVTADGNTAHVLQLPRGWPPTDPRGFWSLTMYDERGFLLETASNRYSISNRTPGIHVEKDGSLKLYLQCKDPGGAKTANWLPAPCGKFSATMRLYLPTAAALEPSFTLPPLS